MLAMDKPWLACLLLDKWARQIGAATRASQKKLEKAAGKETYVSLFSAADQLLMAIRESSQAMDSDKFQARAKQDSSNESELEPRSSGGEVPDGMLPRVHHCGPALCSVEVAEKLLQDRLDCIRIVLKQELFLSLGLHAMLEHPTTHVDVLRRNVAAHPRSTPTALVSALSGKQLGRAQKGIHACDLHKFSIIDARLQQLEASIGIRHYREQQDAQTCTSTSATFDMDTVHIVESDGQECPLEPEGPRKDAADDIDVDDSDQEGASFSMNVTQGEALQPPIPADLGLPGITATVQALGRPMAEGVGHRDAEPRSAVLRHSQQDHGLMDAGHASGEALQPPRPTDQEILGITANVQALGRLLDEGEGPWHADASQGALRHSHHGIGPQSDSLTDDQPGSSQTCDGMRKRNSNAGRAQAMRANTSSTYASAQVSTSIKRLPPHVVKDYLNACKKSGDRADRSLVCGYPEYTKYLCGDPF